MWARLRGALEARGQPPAAATSCLTISELIPVVGANPCVRSNGEERAGWRLFGAGGLDRVTELRERDLGSAHQARSAVDGPVAQESADLVGRGSGPD